MADTADNPVKIQNLRVVVSVAGQPLKLEHAPIPTPPQGGAVIKLLYSGVCHSDLHIASRVSDPRVPYPIVLGHEMCGEVYSVADDYTSDGPPVGTVVSIYPWGRCGDCPFCMSEAGMCRKGAFDFETPVPPNWFGVSKDGGFQQYVSVYDPQDLIPLPTGLPQDVAAISCCSGLTSTNAAQALCPSITTAVKVKGKAVVAISGCGGLAWWAIQILRAMHGNDLIICAIDVVPEKLEYAREAGADKVFQWPIEGEGIEISKQLTSMLGDRLDAAIDFVGAPSTLERLFYSLDVNATVALVGLGGAGGANTLPPIVAPIIAMRNAHIRGIQVGSPVHLRSIQHLVINGKVKPPPITHVTLNNLNEVMADMRAGKIMGRAVIKL